MITTRKLLFGGFLFCFSLFVAALYMQHVMELEPCPLCILQRVLVMVTGIFFLIAAIHNLCGSDWFNGITRCGRFSTTCLVAEFACRSGTQLRPRNGFYYGKLSIDRCVVHGAERFRRMCGSILDISDPQYTCLDVADLCGDVRFGNCSCLATALKTEFNNNY